MSRAKNIDGKEKNANSEKTIWVVTSEVLHEETRSIGDRTVSTVPLQVDQLSLNINLFLGQLSEVLKETPEKIGKFQFSEFEISAEVSADGKLVILGTGIEAGAKGGLKFVFRRSQE